MENQLLDLFKRVLEIEDIDVSCSQENCDAWESLKQLNLAIEIEMEFDISLEPEEIAAMTSFAKTLALVKSKLDNR